MSFRRALWGLAVAVCLVAPVAVHAQGDYLDVFIVKVKPEKVADFQALAKKWADANNRFNGDRWLALEALYGEGNVYQFTSNRKDYAEIDKMNEAVMAAVNKAFGKEAAEKMGRDFDNCLVSSRSELRRRRDRGVHSLSFLPGTQQSTRRSRQSRCRFLAPESNDGLLNKNQDDAQGLYGTRRRQISGQETLAT